ncbi:MAG: SpaA isopeptide-forming pilin-related protein [Peptoniphilus sp.]|nr:SpaA isopeptide-forming pilin-related protein [Peptoniphilus sp.]MDY3118224.1 SpaA isopeptide-forming pilin-related protein [Peptoniphilus sp.]
MNTGFKRVASLLMAMIMMLEVFAPGVARAQSANQNRAVVSDEEFVPSGDVFVPSGQKQNKEKTPAVAEPATVAPARQAPVASPGEETYKEVPKAEVSEEKAPQPLVQDNPESKEMALEFAEEKEKARVASPMNPGGIEDKKFTILTRFDVSTAHGVVRKGQTFTLHLDEKLTVKDPSTLKRLSYNGKVITEVPVYNKDANTITYTLKEDINEDIQVPMKVDVDYNTANIDPDAKEFTVINRVTGIGLAEAEDLLPVVVDANGNMLSTIIELGRDDVVQVIEEGDNYKVNVDAYGEPVVKDSEMAGIRWTVKITSDSDLHALGLKTNFTTVKGSGLGEIENIAVTNVTVPAGDIKDNASIKGNLGIVDSKHHNVSQTTKELYYTFYTPRTTKQTSYMLDLSAVLTNKKEKGTDKPVAGAVRLILPEGYSQDQIQEATPTRVGMNNRTTIMGEFCSENKATWTVTDAVSSKDPESERGLPLESRSLGDNQSLQPGGGRMAVYGIDAVTGEMVVKTPATNVDGFPAQGENPGAQDVGTIAVWELQTDLKNATSPQDYTVSGVSISKYEDLSVNQEWGEMPEGVRMPAQNFVAKDSDGSSLGTWSVEKGEPGKTQRKITLADVKFWNIENDGTAKRWARKIEQQFTPEEEDIAGRTYRYYENLNYYMAYEKVHYMQNRAVETTTGKPGTFSVLKVDSKDLNKKLQGATYRLNGAGVEATTGPDGKATFSNIEPGAYTLVETKAPSGYKLDQSSKTVTITTNGDISVTGSNTSFSGGGNKTVTVNHDSYPNWPDYMNAMHYGKLEENGRVAFYLYLKPNAATQGATDRDTRLHISIPGVNVTDVSAYDVDPHTQRETIRRAMEEQNVDTKIASLGENVVNRSNSKMITGAANVTDPYTGRSGYRVYFPKERFADDWGFLVKVTANVGADQSSVHLYYDWLTDRDTENQTNLQQIATINKEASDDMPTVTITNEEFQKQPVSVTKVDKDKRPLKGATFALKDANGRAISDQDTKDDGVADFGKLAPGKYIIEETKAPDGYIASDTVFDVTVGDDGKVTYKARFKDGAGDPVLGTDYYKDTEESGQEPGEVSYKILENKMEIQENEPGYIGTRDGVWEAYDYEALKYTAKIEVSSSAPGTRFSIQFDPNLDFKQYVNDMPKIKNGRGVKVADPYFDYSTNRLTYVFNDKSGGGVTTANIHIRGIVPNKYYAKTDGYYRFNITVLPGINAITSGMEKQTTNFGVEADYGNYDYHFNTPAQANYFGDIYTNDDGEQYFTVISYYNPFSDSHRNARWLKFNWMSTANGGANANVTQWPGNGNTPAFDLQNVKIYRTDPNIGYVNGKRVNYNMPLSFGVRPGQDPETYSLVYEKDIDAGQALRHSGNGFTLDYNPGEIQSWGTLNQKSPLEIYMRQISSNEGYVIEQTFKVTDRNKWINLFRAFYMFNGKLESAFASKVNYILASADQTHQEIPKFYKEKIKLVNRAYTPGEFSIYKYDETDSTHKLAGATFALTDEKGRTVYRSSGGDGRLRFSGLSPGNYTLEETKAPNNFLKSDKHWQVTVNSTGKVTITELGLGGHAVSGNAITLDVSNKPVSPKFRIYKKNGNGEPLPGATFSIKKQGVQDTYDTATSNEHGVVEFTKPLGEGGYLLEETTPPAGYKKQDKKWVVIVGKDNKAKVYNYLEGGGAGSKTVSLPAAEGTNWVDVAHRPVVGWNLYDNRWSGYVNDSRTPYKMGTRIIAINKEQNYVVQRFIVNPEGNTIPASKAQIHREKPEYANMDWYEGVATIKAFTLDKPVTGNVEDLRLTNYTANEIHLNQTSVSRPGEPNRMELALPEATGPIVIDVKLPYKSTQGGVGLGMDYTVMEDGEEHTYWKSDYYERASDIVLGEAVALDETTSIVGSYISEGSLDVTNELKKYELKLKKIKEGDETQAIEGATFSLQGPEPTEDKRSATTAEDGTIVFEDLTPGTYKLTEDRPAPGYDPIAADWYATVTVTREGKIYIKESTPAAVAIGEDAEDVNNRMSRAATLENFLAPFRPSATSVRNDPLPSELGEEIPEGKLVLIKNRQTGLDLKIFKKTFYGKGLENAVFSLQKMKDDTYKTLDTSFGTLKAKSDKTGRLIFVDGNDEPLDPQIKLKEGYYKLTENTPPAGYKKIAVPWKIHIKEDKGQLVAEYYGPKETSISYIVGDDAKVQDLTTTPSGIKYASRVVSIDPEAKTFRQRVYLDTRGVGEDVVNVQIYPVVKRDEIEKPGQAPETRTPGVKTAYRTTYKVATEGVEPDVDDVLKTYDLSNEHVSMVNTARWRPFDWGFDEDQLNLKAGVYFIDVEGYYDDNIIEKGQIDITFDFFRGERTFREATGVTNGYVTYKGRDKVTLHDSYQSGDAAIAKALGSQGDAWKNKTPEGEKYPNWLGKLGGRIYPAIDPDDPKDVDNSYVPPMESQTTHVNLQPLYTTDEAQRIPQEGMTITNEEETYGVTFSKHGRDNDEWTATGEEVTNNRLEGAVFKLQQWVANSNTFEDIQGSYVGSAFNGYFGFRGLKPGRYRLLEVKAPEGYVPVKDPILYFSVAYTEEELHITDETTGKTKIIPGKSGYITLEYGENGNGIYEYIKPDGGLEGAKLVDFVTSATARNMGKIVNEKPGKGKVTIHKVDEEGNPLKGVVADGLNPGAKFRLTRTSARDTAEGEEEVQSVYTGTVNEDGTLTFENLPIGNYRLEEIKPHDGHLSTDMVWNFTVGGKDLDPYAEDTNRPTRDVTEYIELKDSKVKVQKYMDEDDTSTDNTIYPHKAQSVSIVSNFKVKDTAPGIQPGDYFTVKVSDSIDLQGIYKNRTIGNLDIFSDGVGTIAKAVYDKDRGTITYTFTDYAKIYSLQELKTSLVAWINLEKVTKSSKDVPVGIGLDGEDMKTENLDVEYNIDAETSSYPDYNLYGYNHNISGKIYELDPDTGEFVQYYYINRKRLDGKYMPRFQFSANQELYDVHISIDKLKDNEGDGIDKWMPESFAVPSFDNGELSPIVRYDRSQLSWYTYDFKYNRNEGMGPDDSYIVTVRGKVDPKTAKELHTFGNLQAYNEYGYVFNRVSREDWAYFDENQAEAKTELSIRAVNPKNKIVFRKIDEDNKPLKGAKFLLYKEGENGYDVYTDVTSGEDGLITFDRLSQGNYYVVEEKAPDGYVKNPEKILEFTVDEKGKVLKKVAKADGKTHFVEETGSVPIPVVNHKGIQLEKKDAHDKDLFLAGAEFDVYYREKTTDQYKPYKVKGADGGEVTYHVKVGDAGTNKGKVGLNLYKAGEYALKETVAPEGYMKAPGFIREFTLKENHIAVKDKGFEGNIGKEPYGSDVSTSFVLAEKNESTPGAYTTYVVINPNHDERSYDPDSNALLHYEDVKSLALSAYRIDKDGNRAKFAANVTWVADENPKIDLYKAVGGANEEKYSSTDTIVLKLTASPKETDAPDAGEVLTTKVTDASGTAEAVYRFHREDLPASIDEGKYPKHPAFTVTKPQDYDTNEKAKADYDKAYADYKKTLAEVVDHYRKTDLLIKYDGSTAVEVLNTKAVYPFTGGFGPRWIVAIGAAMAALAAEEYIRRRKKAAPKGGDATWA